MLRSDAPLQLESPFEERKEGFVKAFAAAVLLLAAMSLSAQINPPTVVVTGNSIALYEHGLESNIFPYLSSSQVFITGHKSYSCNAVRQGVKYDVFGPGGNSWHPSVAVLIDTTNDWQQGTLPGDLLSCLSGTVTDLLAIKNDLQIVILTTPPYVPFPGGCTMGDYRPTINQYNALMVSLQFQFQGRVTVLDAFTPFALPTGWADPSKMIGACGIHPGQPGVWDAGQIILAGIYSDTVKHLLGL
jgi:hypothetical protein